MNQRYIMDARQTQVEAYGVQLMLIDFQLTQLQMLNKRIFA